MQVSQLQHNCALNYRDVPHDRLIRANRIICTIGPKTQSVEGLKGLIRAGMSVARMNFSHGSHEYHQATIDNVRAASAELKVPIAIALDTKGPEIRTGLMADPNGVKLIAGQTVLVTCDKEFEEKGNNEKFYLDYANLTKVTKVGGRIYIDDGILSLTILRVVDDKTLEVRVNNDHLLTNRKGTNLPNADVDLPAVSERDKLDLQFGARNCVDIVFASFIRNAQQVRDVRAALGERGSVTQIISKIENHQGMDNIDEIIAESDGIMVARGDLGVEIPAEKVTVAQKMMIAKCNVAGKPVICATQMLESMTYNPRPTRAEVSDVANAVLDGADCVMLSGETAKGLYPNEVVRYMARICLEAQNATNTSVVYQSIKSMQPTPMPTEEAICCSAVSTVLELNAKAIVVLSNTGRSVRFLAKYRPPCPIICVSMQQDQLRALTLVRDVFPVHYDKALLEEDPTRERRVQFGMMFGMTVLKYLNPGDVVVAVHADARTASGMHFANMVRALVVPEQFPFEQNVADSLSTAGWNLDDMTQ
jgi:pyruvate kinase